MDDEAKKPEEVEAKPDEDRPKTATEMVEEIAVKAGEETAEGIVEGTAPPGPWMLIVFDKDGPWTFSIQTSGDLIPSHFYAVGNWLTTQAQDTQRRSMQMRDMERVQKQREAEQDEKDLAAMMGDPDLKVKPGGRVPKIPKALRGRRRKR